MRNKTLTQLQQQLKHSTDRNNREEQLCLEAEAQQKQLEDEAQRLTQWQLDVEFVDQQYREIKHRLTPAIRNYLCGIVQQHIRETETLAEG